MLIDKRELQLVDYSEMNDVHFEEVEIVNEIHATILKIENGENLQKELKEKLNGFVEHTIGHFGNEEKLMDQFMFPATHCHVAEHQSALANIKNVVSNYADTEDLAELKDFIEKELVSWLGSHIATMDMVTASFIAQQS